MKSIKNSFPVKAAIGCLLVSGSLGILIESKDVKAGVFATVIVFFILYIPCLFASAFGVIGDMVTRSINHENSPIRKKYMRDLKTRTVATLCAAAMRSDGIVSDKEKEVLDNYLRKHIESETQRGEIYNRLNKLLKNKVFINEICLEARKELPYKDKFEICNLLLEIAAVENGICTEEVNLINKIMKYLFINETDRELLWSAFGFRHREKEYEANTYTPTTNYELTKYLNILESDSSTPLSEIKKRYKKLCIEHHPDKYENSDETTKNYHSERMKEINEAYEYVLKHYN